jgi:regulatory protein
MSSKLTALRRTRPGWVALEVDGRRWRTVPDEVVVRCGLSAGVDLDRPLLRRVRTELRHAEALATAGRALSRRSLSRRSLEERLRKAGVAPTAEASAMGVLSEAGLVDDARLARARAETLAARGWGNRAIETRLTGEGIGGELARVAVADLPPEAERAGPLVSELPPRKAWTLLARRGFDPDTIDSVLGALDAEA